MYFTLFFLFSILGFSDPQEISLGNNYLTVTWNISDSGSLLTQQLLNQRSKPEVKVVPQIGSEEFTISILRDNSSPYPLPISDKSKWKISSNSEKNLKGDDGPITNLIDNNPQTIWHSWESEEDDATGHDDRDNHTGDYNITIDFGENLTFKAISFTQKPRNIDGVVRKFKLFVGSTLEDVTEKVQQGEFVLDSYFSQDKNKNCFLNLTTEITAQFIVITTQGDGKFGTGAQFDIYSDFLPYVNDVIKASSSRSKMLKKKKKKSHSHSKHMN